MGAIGLNEFYYAYNHDSNNLLLFNDLAFDADGYGLYFKNAEHAQTVEGHTPFSLQFEFSKHLHSFLLNGLTSVSLHGQVLNIMNVSGKTSLDRCI